MEMKIREYIGLQFAPSLAMAIFDKVVTKKIDEESSKIDIHKRKLSTGKAAKAMIGTMFTEGKRKPLYRVNAQYMSSPRSELFGDNVKHETLSDTNLASRLETIFKMDMDSMIYDCYSEFANLYSIKSNILRMDSTNFPFYGLKYDQWDDGGALPKYTGHSKNKRTDLLHKSIQALCDGNGIVMTSKSYPGNTSDIQMNRDTLLFIKRHMNSSKYTIIADCKACVADIIGEMIDMKMSFVTKVPNNFSEMVRKTVIDKAINGGMYESASYPGRFVYDTEMPVSIGDGVKQKLRLVAFTLPNSFNRAKNYLETKGLSVIEKRMKALERKRFFCESDAAKAFADAVSDDAATPYVVKASYEIDYSVQRKDPKAAFWKIVVHGVFTDLTKIDYFAKKHSVSVLLTDIKSTEKDFINPKNGKTADGVIDLYLRQDGIEKCFKIVKSGTGVANIFIHKPSRQDAIVFLSTIATMISNVVDYVLKRELKDERVTMKHISDYLMSIIVRYNPVTKSIWMMGEKEPCLFAQRVMEILGVKPSDLIGQ